MRRLFIFLWPGLLFVSCDKPGSSSDSKEAPPSQQQGARSRHASREQSHGTPSKLRSLLQDANAIESPAAREKALAEIAWNALEIDPELACEAFHQLPAGGTEKIRLIQHYAMRLAEQNLDEALKWAAALGDERDIAAAYGQIALVLAETRPQDAANLLSESGMVSHEFDVTVVQVLQRWSGQSPPDAAAWAVLFPPGPAREAGIKIIAEQWLSSDAPAAFAWFDSLKEEDLRKEAAQAIQVVIVQKPQKIQKEWREIVDARIWDEIDQQRENAIKDVGDNIQPPES